MTVTAASPAHSCVFNLLAKKGLLGCRIAKQVSEFYREIEQLNSIGMLRKYLGKVRVLTTTYMADEASPVPWP